MARPIKKEPDYVPLDTDLLSNRKIRQIKRKYGSDTFLLYIALLCDIYANGYYITGGIKAFQRVTGLVLLEYLAEKGKLTLFLVSRDIIAIGIDVTKQGNI